MASGIWFCANERSFMLRTCTLVTRADGTHDLRIFPNCGDTGNAVRLKMSKRIWMWFFS